MTLSAPSWVIPGTWAENARHLAGEGRVASVELLLFSYDADSRGEFLRDLPELEKIAAGGRFGYGVHLPRHPDERDAALEDTARLASRYVVHPPRDAAALDDFAAWHRASVASVEAPVFVENVDDASFRRALEALPDAAVCLDTGHALLAGRSPAELAAELTAAGRTIGEVHLHGVGNGKDHAPFDGTEPWLAEFRPFLERFGGVVEVEVFSAAGLSRCLDALRDLIGRGGGSK